MLGGEEAVPIKYQLPPFLEGKVDRKVYVRWLGAKAQAHVFRDRKRWNRWIGTSEYKRAIHSAVLRSQGRDYYTNKRLDWSLLSKYDNTKSRAGGSAYKKKFALLPTVDHVAPEERNSNFEICSWRTNDCKNDLSLAELKAFCRKVLAKSSR